MENILGIVVGMIFAIIILIALFELRIRQANVLILHETKDGVGIRKGLVYPRHFSLVLKRTPWPIQLKVETTATGNLGVRAQIVGSVSPSLEHIGSLIRVGGWNSDAVVRAADQALIVLAGLVKEYAEQTEIHALSSTGLLNYLNQAPSQTKTKFGLELITLAVQTLEPTDPEIADALRQQEQARLLEQTERLNNQARMTAAKAKFEADEKIVEIEHALELKKAELDKERIEIESALARQRLEEELERNRMRLAFEKEELDVLKSNPELLMLTPQAARLAEASQSLKNARTVISLTPQELAHGPELLALFQSLLQKNLEENNKA